ncbi:hypothetical protein JZK55_17680 [Dissulfurispira thermophila]|uniref:Uncharacterized protein n=2 Tax=root TaxID=1 RepID=A0A7G1H4L1_9BACT|nr:hypothetical protein [Dissulfurispira thermophila]BCB96846.1 hypothetical protein JZK55_17680 [Dissulfurispira thermophila]
MGARKKIAVIVRDRQSEALRMSIGLSVLNDVDIYIFDRRLESSDDILLNLEMIKELKLGLYTNTTLNEGIEYIPIEDIAKRLLKYDNILPY